MNVWLILNQKYSVMEVRFLKIILSEELFRICIIGDFGGQIIFGFSLSVYIGHPLNSAQV